MRTSFVIYYETFYDKLKVVLLDSENSLSAIAQLHRDVKDVTNVIEFNNFNKLLSVQEKADFMEQYHYHTPII